MKILWLVNIELTEVALKKDKHEPTSGSWLVNSSKTLSEMRNIELSICYPDRVSRSLKAINGERITYYSFPTSKKIDKLEKQLKEIILLVKPDIVHIFGTEYKHSLAMVNICEEANIKYVINIQGLVSILSKHYQSYLPEKVFNKFTIYEFLRRFSLKNQKSYFANAGKDEIEALKKAKHVIGRTTWDKACTNLINPAVNYYHCDEILREEFYKNKWNIETCEKNSIFISQGWYPVKGLHLLLEALPGVIQEFPNTVVYISGYSSNKNNFKTTTYQKYLYKLINSYGLEKHIVFTGVLNEKQMCERFLKSNLFISSSVVENESNSLSEAKILGVPAIASFAGGVASRIEQYNDGVLYQPDAPYMLEYHIKELFRNPELAIKLSENAKRHAKEIFNVERNILSLNNIYEDINKI